MPSIKRTDCSAACKFAEYERGELIGCNTPEGETTSARLDKFTPGKNAKDLECPKYRPKGGMTSGQSIIFARGQEHERELRFLLDACEPGRLMFYSTGDELISVGGDQTHVYDHDSHTLLGKGYYKAELESRGSGPEKLRVTMTGGEGREEPENLIMIAYGGLPYTHKLGSPNTSRCLVEIGRVQETGHVEFEQLSKATTHGLIAGFYLRDGALVLRGDNVTAIIQENTEEFAV